MTLNTPKKFNGNRRFNSTKIVHTHNVYIGSDIEVCLDLFVNQFSGPIFVISDQFGLINKSVFCLDYILENPHPLTTYLEIGHLYLKLIFSLLMLSLKMPQRKLSEIEEGRNLKGEHLTFSYINESA